MANEEDLKHIYIHETYNRAMTAYQDIIDEVFENRDKEFILEEVMMRAEILKRNFTKRQLIIIWTIKAFSYPYGKRKALLPKLKDFEVVGIQQSKIKEELVKLKEMSIIDYDESVGYYWLQDPRKWKAQYQKSYDNTRSIELFMLNISDAGIDIEKLLKKISD